MTNHTPGPWRTSRDAVPEDHVQITVYAESDGDRVATVFRTKENATLIAMAPEMAEMLITVLPYVEMAAHDPSYKPGAVREIVRQLRSVINEATGGAW